MVEYYIILLEIKNYFDVPNLINTYITFHYNANILVCFPKMCFYISREAVKATCDYVI